MIKTIKENPAVSWLGGGFTVALFFSGVVWAVDARIDQRTAQQMQQLRSDIVQDFEQNRIDYLLMKKRAAIINSDESIELQYLIDQKTERAGQ